MNECEEFIAYNYHDAYKSWIRYKKALEVLNSKSKKKGIFRK